MASITTSPSGGIIGGERAAAYRFGVALKIERISWPVLLSAVLLVVGLVIATLGVLEEVERRRIDQLTAQVTGWVVSRDRVESDGEETYRLSYRFTHADETYTGQSTVPAEVYYRHFPGQSVGLYYRTDNPLMSGVRESEAQGLIPWAAAAGLGLTLVAGAGLSVALRHHQARRRLPMDGRVISAEVVAIRPLDLDDNRYAVDVYVRFYAPDSEKRVEGKRRHEVDAVKVTLLPEIGSVVQVLYLSPSVWELL